MAKRSCPLLLLLFVVACEDPMALERTFVVHVDTVEAPASVRFEAPLSLRFQGVIGPDLCHHFERFDAVQTESRLDLTVIGRYDNPGGVCPTALAELRGREYVKPPPHADPVRVVVHQPDGSTLELQVQVTDAP